MTNTITIESAYPLIHKYVKYHYNSGKFYSLCERNELGDLENDVVLHFISHDYLSKYDPSRTTLAYFINVAVYRFFVDKLRKHKDYVSLDTENAEGLTLGDTVADVRPQPYEKVESTLSLLSILDELEDDTTSDIIVVCPHPELKKATPRALAILLSEGYSQKEISKMFINPRTGQPVTSGRVSQMVKDIREILTLCGYADGSAYSI